MNLRKEKICILNKDGRSDYWGNIDMGALPDIRIYIKDGNNYRKTPSIFATVSHELGHVSHCTLLFVDLVDNYNQGANNPALPFDEVYGFSYSTLNMLLLLSKDIESLKENLKIWKPSFISNVQIDKLFECYENNY